MKFRQGVAYLLSIVFIYVFLFLVDLTIISAIIELFTTSSFVKLVCNVVFLLIVNPILTYLIGERIPFKIYGLKVEEGIEADLKKDVDL